jgi:hypothetical protein
MKTFSFPHHLFLALFFLFCATGLTAQIATYDTVYTLLQTHCATAYCHSGGAPTGNLNMGGTKADVYNAIVGAVPDNSVAASKGLSIIAPGYPRKSFLMKKINNHLDTQNDLEAGEGVAMPNGGAPLSNAEIELIRQWILFAAPDTGQVVNTQLIHDFYNGGGKTKITPLQAPDAADGFQVLVGPIFLAPHSEVEYSIKQQLFNTTPLKVTEMNAVMNDESHHLATFKYLPSRDTIMPVGLRKIAGIADAAGVFYNSTIIAEWANSLDLNLPEGTAFFWGDSSVIDFNYHVLNYSDSILAAEVYINIGTQANTQNLVEMKAQPVYYGGDDVAALVIPNSGDTTFTMEQFDPDSTYNWNLFMIVAHTHAHGKNFNVWMRNADGTKGDHIYNGHYNENYTFDQGFFDWEHPPVRLMDPMLPVDMSNGLIHEAMYTNNGVDTIYFGLTTLDEMFVTYLLYTDELPSGINNIAVNNNGVSVYPNPTSNRLTVKLDEPGLTSRIEFYNLMGEMVQKEELSGKSSQLDLELPDGIYLYHVYIDNELKSSNKLVLVR